MERSRGRRSILMAVALTAALAFPAGVGVAQITRSPDRPQAVVVTSEPPKVQETTFDLTVNISGPSAADACYADAVGWLEVLQVIPGGGGSRSLLDQGWAAPVTCDEAEVVLQVPRVSSYVIAKEDGSAVWGPYSFSYLERSGWTVYLADEMGA